MVLFGFEFSVFTQIILSVLLISFFYQLYFYTKYLYAIKRRESRISKGKLTFTDECPPVSVIICAKDEYENLVNFLPQVLQQDYPEFEVIVVNDGSLDDTSYLLANLQLEHPRLKTTFVPVGTSNLSTKKLAITLGVKAAKYDWLLFTDADCYPSDNQWIKKMARNFKTDKEIVLGIGAYEIEKGFLNKLISYDTLFIAMQYIGFAANGIPYMGVGRNMAYKKDVFFRNKGFASTLHLRSGDDDLMINQRAYKENTTVETSQDSVTWSKPKKTFREWFEQKERHLSVSTFYKNSTKFQLVAEPVFRGLFYLSFILSMISYNWISLGLSVLLFVTRYVIQSVVINRTSVLFGNRKYYFTLFIFDIYIPLVQLYLLIFGRMGEKAERISWK